jgi:hypothetical protein
MMELSKRTMPVEFHMVPRPLNDKTSTNHKGVKATDSISPQDIYM